MKTERASVRIETIALLSSSLKATCPWFWYFFDSIPRQQLWKIIQNDRMPLKIAKLLKALLWGISEPSSRLRRRNKEFSIELGVKQERVLSPTLFNYCVDWVLNKTIFFYSGFRLDNIIHFKTLITLIILESSPTQRKPKLCSTMWLHGQIALAWKSVQERKNLW